MSKEMPRSAASDPNRFSIFWKEIPKPIGGALDKDATLLVFAANAIRLALDQAAYRLFQARTLAGVIFFSNRAGLVA
jgi:hypothetical protein